MMPDSRAVDAAEMRLEHYHPSVLARKAVGLWTAVVRNGN
jgi:hypothetical protein